ncbi:MAG: response regulator [Candidatus Fermentibacteraceae bacterium]|nr:response regulator [Candidatus Fermentibacteraceae bacterium]MBN2609371.1 response regulator [Candidatus Fermentibacteraceae bacterium]
MPKDVLIVDDDFDFVDTTELVLKSHGYETRTAHDGEEALQKVVEKIPDLMLLDIMMKTKGDGIWVSEQIRSKESTKGIPIIMITAVNQDADMLKFHFEKDVGTDSSYLPVNIFMEKPIEINDLLEEINRLIGAP